MQIKLVLTNLFTVSDIHTVNIQQLNKHMTKHTMTTSNRQTKDIITTHNRQAKHTITKRNRHNQVMATLNILKKNQNIKPTFNRKKKTHNGNAQQKKHIGNIQQQKHIMVKTQETPH